VLARDPEDANESAQVAKSAVEDANEAAQANQPLQ
jgi:hypothetical protein